MTVSARDFVILAALAVMQCGCGGGSRLSDPPLGGGNPNIPQFTHVFVVVEENHGYGDVIGNNNMPYLNGLAKSNALATVYYANAHPSLPNYFVLTTGATVTDTNAYTGTVTQDNVVRALASAGKTWKCYAESLPSTGYLGGDNLPYMKHHNPFVYLSDVVNDPNQASNVVPFTQLSADLGSNSFASYSFIVPNTQNDGHDCPGSGTSCTDTQKLAAIDQWLQNNLDGLLKSSAFQSSLVIITFDEAKDSDTQNGGGHVATLIISPKAKPGYQSTTLYQHESTLRLTLKALGVSDLPGNAASATDMGEFFQ